MKSETIKRKQKVRVGLVARKEYEGNLQVYALNYAMFISGGRRGKQKN